MALETKTWHGRPVRAFAGRAHSLGELLTTTAARHPESTAVRTPLATLTYEELHSQASAFAAMLSSQLGAQPGDRMAILLPNRAEWVIAFFGAALAGVIGVPIDARLTPAEAGPLLERAGVTVLVTTLDLWKPLADTPLGARVDVVAVDSALGLDGPVRVGASGGADRRTGSQTPPAGTEDDIAAIFFTSGSTGHPKGALLTHANLIHAALNARTCVGLDADSRVLIVAPLSHVASCDAQLIATISTGGRADLLPSFKVDDTVRWMADEQVSHFFGVPAMYELLLTHRRFDGAHLPALRCCAYGGAPCSPVLGPRLRRALPGVRLGNGFGLTETASVATFLPDHLVDAKPTSVGVPCPVNEVRIVDDRGDDVAPGCSGELLIGGPTVFWGYEFDTDSEGGRSAVSDGWVRTGDVARMDADGCIYVVDRVTDMIIRGGENIYCIEVENVLQSHPAVAEAALVGVPDGVMGEEGRAIVVPEPGVPVTVEEILRFCGQVLAPFKVPRYVELRSEALPRTPTGKLVKNALRPPAPDPRRASPGGSDGEPPA